LRGRTSIVGSCLRDAWRIGARVACGWRGADRRSCRGPCERVLLSPGDALNVDQLLDDLLQRGVVQRELPPQHPQRQAAVLFEVAPHLTDDVEEIHRADSASS